MDMKSRIVKELIEIEKKYNVKKFNLLKFQIHIIYYFNRTSFFLVFQFRRIFIEVVEESANFVLHGDKTACDFSFPDNLWLVEIDKSQISQVVQNIILNASNAMPDGGIVEVSCENVNTTEALDLELSRKRRYVKISFKDHTQNRINN